MDKDKLSHHHLPIDWGNFVGKADVQLVAVIGWMRTRRVLFNHTRLLREMARM